MGTQVSSKLCTLIEARVAEFNHVIKLSHTQCVPTALRMLLQSRRNGGPRGVVERALRALVSTGLPPVKPLMTLSPQTTRTVFAFVTPLIRLVELGLPRILFCTFFRFFRIFAAVALE
jgi:hypothetical protein